MKMKFPGLKRPVALVIAIAVILALAIGSFAFFSDRANSDFSLSTATFTKDGYSLGRTVNLVPYLAGEDISITVLEDNEKNEPVQSEITMSVSWSSPDSSSSPFGNAESANNAAIKVDGTAVNYTYDKNTGKITFKLPAHKMAASTTDNQRVVTFHIPESLKSTGTLSFTFDKVKLSQPTQIGGTGFYVEYNNEELNKKETLDFDADVVWDLSETLGTKKIIGYLTGSNDDFGLTVTGSGIMHDWTSASVSSQSNYKDSITSLTIEDGITNIGDYAFAGFSEIQSIEIPQSVAQLGAMSFGYCGKLTEISFNRATGADIVFPTAGSETGAFYVPSYLKTTFDFNGNTDAENYDWVSDHRMKVGITNASLSYNDVVVGKTVDPSLDIDSDNYDKVQSIKYEIIAGEKYASVDENTGVVTGLAEGVATVKVTIVDANGNTVTAESDVNVCLPILAANSTWYSQGGTTIKRSQVTSIDIVDTYDISGKTIVDQWDASTISTGADDESGPVTAYLESDGNGGYKLTIAGCGYGKIYANPDSSFAFSNINYTSDTDSTNYFNNVTVLNGSTLLDVSRATTLQCMFYEAASLTSIDVSNWETDNVTSMYGTFASYVFDMALTTLDLGNWNTSKVTSMAMMFQNCTSLTEVNAAAKEVTMGGKTYSAWNVGNVTTMQNMFMHCYELTTIDVKNWNTGNVTNMQSMFSSCYSLTKLDVANWNTGKVKTFRLMFGTNADSDVLAPMQLADFDVSNWNTSSATNMSGMFNSCIQLTEIDLSKWDVSKVTNMESMFGSCVNMTSYNFTGWNTASLTNTKDMFVYNNSLVELDLTSFNTANIKGTAKMFAFSENLETIYVSDRWNLNKDKLLTGHIENMFNGCDKLVGGAGTAWAANHVDYTNPADDSAYAIVDGKDGNAGYLTNNIFLSYKDILVDETADAQLTIKSKVFSAADSAEYEIVSGSQYITLDTSTGKVTGKDMGTATVKVTLTATNGDTITAEADVNVSSPILAANSTWYSQGGTTIKRSQVTSIDIVDTYDISGKTIVDQWDASTESTGADDESGPVTAYLESDGNGGYKLTIAGCGYGKIYANPDSSYAFSDIKRADCFTAVKKIDGAAFFDTIKATTMYGTFYNCNVLTDVEVGNWNVSNVTNMSGMFRSCFALETLDVADWNVGMVRNMSAMFSDAVDNSGRMKLKNIDVSNWNTSFVTNMSGMFYGCSQLTEIDCSKWDVSKVSDMNHMFADCFNMTNYNFSGWNTSNLTNMNAMFNDNNSLISIDVSDLDVGKVNDFAQLFEACDSLSNIVGLDQWDTSSAGRFLQAFSGCTSLTELDLSAWDTSSVVNACQMFRGCSSLETIYVSDRWDMSNLADTTFTQDGVPTACKFDIFVGCTKLVGGAGTSWAANHVDYTNPVDDSAYAIVDGKDGKAGYLTNNIFLSYKDILVDETADAQLTIKSKVFDDYASAQYKIVDGDDVIFIDENTGVVTGLAVGTATVKVTLTATNGDTITTQCAVNVSSGTRTTYNITYNLNGDTSETTEATEANVETEANGSDETSE